MSTEGRVASLHLHPETSGAPFQPVAEIHVEAGKGIVGNPRYFGRKNRDGEPSRRQVSLIAREQVAAHASALGRVDIPAGAVRANIETAGIDLMALVDSQVEIGSAILSFYEPRRPCPRMDQVAPGLQRLMANGRQGVMAQVLRSGRIRVGDPVHARPANPEAPNSNPQPSYG